MTSALPYLDDAGASRNLSQAQIVEGHRGAVRYSHDRVCRGVIGG